MGTKTIGLDEDTYERLRDEKREGESFSDVVDRLLGERSLTELAGLWDGDTVAEIEGYIEEGREASRARSDRVVDELESDADAVDTGR